MASVENRRICEYVPCKHLLETANDHKTGLCSSCREHMQHKEIILCVCWECQTITQMVTNNSRHYRDYRFPKYLISKGCRNCINGTPELEKQWLTIKGNDLGNKVVTDKGTIIIDANVEN